MPPADRRRRLRETFDAQVGREWSRYSGEPRRVLVRVLRERFLRRHLKGVRGGLLEIGPGPGRFTPTILRSAPGRVLSIDLSRRALLVARSRVGRDPRRSRVSWIHAAGERLPVRDGSADAVVLFGNIVCFAGRDGPRLLREAARALRPGGRLVADFASPAAATQEFFDLMSRRRRLPGVLRRPGHFFVEQVLDTGYQPFDPKRLATWEFQFYTPENARRALERAGFRLVDLMAAGAVSWNLGAVAASARREPRTWENLLRIEERVGRRPGALETGHGFLVAATRGPPRSPLRRTRPSVASI